MRAVRRMNVTLPRLAEETKTNTVWRKQVCDGEKQGPNRLSSTIRFIIRSLKANKAKLSSLQMQVRTSGVSSATSHSPHLSPLRKGHINFEASQSWVQVSRAIPCRISPVQVNVGQAQVKCKVSPDQVSVNRVSDLRVCG